MYGLDSSDSGQGAAESFCKYGNESSDFIFCTINGESIVSLSGFKFSDQK
jgi:hypothetical protein